MRATSMNVVWETVKLPEGKIAVPGVVSHSTDIVEHPELVSQRIQRFARLLGKENVMAGADCGFGGRSHPQIAWAKLKSLVKAPRAPPARSNTCSRDEAGARRRCAGA